MYNRSASSRASIRSFLFPCLLFFRGSHTTSLVTCGFSRSYNQVAQVPSSKVTCNSPRSPWIKSRMTFALVSITHSITSFPAAFLTAIEILSLCTSMPIYLMLVIRVFLSGGVRAEHSKPYSQRGALLYCVGSGAFNRSMQHHLGTKLFKGGVYDPTKTVETYSRGKDRDLASMEVRAVSARDWACFWQTTSHRSQAVVAMWRHSSHRSSPFAVGTDPSGARRHLARNRL